MRPFFIVGHNPNTVEDAINYLEAGANGIEPDIHFTDGEYFMGEGTTSTRLSLVDYLKGLCLELKNNPVLIPAFIMFDTKNSTGDIVQLFNCIQTNYCNQFKKTAILITRSQAKEEEMNFFVPVVPILPPNWALGVDEHTTPEEVIPFFKNMNATSYTYADGISILEPLLGIFFRDRVKRGVALRDKGDNYKMVYAWTVNLAIDVEAYLDLNIDALVTDDPAGVKEIISTRYAADYKLATLGYNPFK